MVVFECILSYLAWLFVSVLSAFGTIDPNFFFYLFLTVGMLVTTMALIIRTFRLFKFNQLLNPEPLPRFHERLVSMRLPSTLAVVLFMISIGIIIGIYTVLFTKITAGVCIAMHTDFGFNVGPVSITTAMTRSISGYYCDGIDNKPCHVYLTLGEEATDVIINFHINEQICNRNKGCDPFVLYKNVEAQEWI